jgi:hypothetical protein
MGNRRGAVALKEKFGQINILTLWMGTIVEASYPIHLSLYAFSARTTATLQQNI